MWFLHCKVILTKDNLVKRSWQGCKSCSFCHKDETIQHLFFECSFAKIVWRIIHMSFGISPPTSVINMFGNWLAGIPKKELMQVRVGVCAIIWAMWNVRNDFILANQRNHPFCRLFPWLRIGSVCGPFLQPVEERHAIDSGCNRLEMVARDIYNQYGWRLDKQDHLLKLQLMATLL
jgi:hypothetical protein